MSNAPDEVEFADPVEPDSGNSTYDSIELDPGTEHVGRITDFDPDAGDGPGCLWVDGQRLWLNNRMFRQLVEHLKGTPIKAEKDSEEQSFTDNNGEEVTYHERNVRFP